MEFNPDPLFWVLCTIAVLMTGVSKGGLGIAGGLSVPILALIMSPVQAAAIMLPILIVMDWVGVWAYRRDWDRKNMAIILPAGILGIAIGWITFKYLNENMIRIILGAIAVSFVLHAIFKPQAAPTQPSAIKGWFWSSLSGLTSFIAHSGGPPLSVYMLPQRLPKAVHVGTTVIYFTAINLVKVIPYLALGLFNMPNITTSIVLAPLGAVGILIGIWVQKKLPTLWFFRVSYAALALTGLKLLYDGLVRL